LYVLISVRFKVLDLTSQNAKLSKEKDQLNKIVASLRGELTQAQKMLMNTVDKVRIISFVYIFRKKQNLFKLNSKNKMKNSLTQKLKMMI
jgi:hypothetical protein